MQDPNTGRLVEINAKQYKEAIADKRAAFHVGEVIQINGGWFRVRKITAKDLVLRGIPTPDHRTDNEV